MSSSSASKSESSNTAAPPLAPTVKTTEDSRQRVERWLETFPDVKYMSPLTEYCVQELVETCGDYDSLQPDSAGPKGPHHAHITMMLDHDREYYDALIKFHEMQIEAFHMRYAYYHEASYPSRIVRRSREQPIWPGTASL